MGVGLNFVTWVGLPGRFRPFLVQKLTRLTILYVKNFFLGPAFHGVPSQLSFPVVCLIGVLSQQYEFTIL